MYGLYTLFKWVITSSLMASVLICIILLTKKLIGRKLGITWHYYIWVLLFIRLAVPFTPQSSLSLFNLVTPVFGNVQTDDTEQTNSLPGYNVEDNTLHNNNTISDTEIKNIEYNNSASYTPYTKISLNSVLMIVWLSGVFSFLFYILILNLRLKKRMEDQYQCTDIRITKVFSECRKEMNISAQIPVMFTGNVHSPSIYGVFRPRLLIPEYIADKISNEEFRYIFLHELAHYKQKDIFINWIAIVLKAIHWFNPIIWYGFYLMRQDCELACDAIALSHIEKDKQPEYGHTIIHLLSLVSFDRFVPSTAGILSKSSKLQIKRRITIISNFKKTTFKCVIIVAVVASVIGVTALTNAKSAAANNINTFSEVKSDKSIIIPQNGKDVATLWAEALNNRDGGLRFSLLSKDLKTQEYEAYSKINWTIGGSSPWVVSYTVNESNKIDNDTTDFEIKYQMTTSEGKYDSNEILTVKKIGSSWFVIKHEDDIYMPPVTRNDSLKIGQNHKESSLVTKDAEGAVNLWAEALKHRNGAVRFSILNSALKNTEYEKYSKMNWVIGGSSPWVTDYSIKQLNKIDDNTYEYEINYTMTDSTKATYYSKENVTVKKLRNWVITKHDDYDYLPEITK